MIHLLLRSMAGFVIAATATASTGTVCEYEDTGFFTGLEFEATVKMQNLSGYFTTVQASVEEAGGCEETTVQVLRPLYSDIPFQFDACGTTHILQPTHYWGVPAAGLCQGFMIYFVL